MDGPLPLFQGSNTKKQYMFVTKFLPVNIEGTSYNSAMEIAMKLILYGY